MSNVPLLCSSFYTRGGRKNQAFPGEPCAERHGDGPAAHCACSPIGFFPVE